MMRAIETDSKMNLRLITEDSETDTRYTISISFDILLNILKGRTNNLTIDGFTERIESISATKSVESLTDEELEDSDED